MKEKIQKLINQTSTLYLVVQSDVEYEPENIDADSIGRVFTVALYNVYPLLEKELKQYNAAFWDTLYENVTDNLSNLDQENYFTGPTINLAKERVLDYTSACKCLDLEAFIDSFIVKNDLTAYRNICLKLVASLDIEANQVNELHWDACHLENIPPFLAVLDIFK